MTALPQKLLAGNFPLRFANGHIVDTLAFWCTRCGEVAHNSQMLGQVSMLLADTADIRATFHCTCGYTNHYRIRLKDDKSYSFMADGAWQQQRPQKQVLTAGLVRWCKEAYWYCKFKWSCFLLQRGLKKLQSIVRNNSCK